MRETVLQTPRSAKKEGKEELQSPEQIKRSSAVPNTGCPPAAHRCPWWSRYPLAVNGGPHTGADGCFLKEVAAHGEPTQEQAPGRNWDQWREAHVQAGFLEPPVTL